MESSGSNAEGRKDLRKDWKGREGLAVKKV